MKWNHLPMGGGLFNQHPVLIDRFYYIMAEKSKHEAAEAAKKEKGTGGGMKPTSRASGRR